MPSRVLVAMRVRATPERAFQAFTMEIGSWWRPNGLFQFTAQGPGRLAFEPGPEGRLVERLSDGRVFEIGRIRVWQPPTELVFGWRQESFRPDQKTEVRVGFEAVGEETRVTVEHLGWDTVPPEHVARHGFPAAIFLRRHAEWWQRLLTSMGVAVAGDRQ
ncbi:MAG TPA: SRPBCC domain-containing protein [Candidatus Dormibacteraeota bacterium]|jgi:uncharacterized protein YndB with AHSA1/START domain|nr:SRPBCC domain-containing protein [Candidatus Dormibacteraeota bacterium]